jgi:hypothetical protein
VTKNNDWIAAFLTCLARDVEIHPDKLSFFPPELAKTIADLTSNVDCDLDAPIESDVMDHPASCVGRRL